MRLDAWLRKVGILKRRTLAARLLRNGLVLVDEHPAKPAAVVRPGQRIRVVEPRRVRTWEVVGIPEGNVRRGETEVWARLVEDVPRDDPELGP